jgi:NAD(P)-dependent dehydrogenase (short-subunit alcohol dehydrogenase family)
MTIMITGASQGIGAASARYFGSRGDNVVLFARNAAALEALETEISAAGGQALAVAGDVTVYANLADAVAQAVDIFGGIDVLVNNAGMVTPVGKLTDIDPVVWAQVAEVNYLGVFHGMHAAIPVMLKAGRGTIINISSGAATGTLEGWSHYCSSKAAALSLTRCGHLEYADQGIRIIGLSPGTVATPMQDLIRASGINPVSKLDPAVHIPPQWVAQAIEYLCSDAGDEFAGTDFLLKTDAARQRLGLPAVL